MAAIPGIGAAAPAGEAATGALQRRAIGLCALVAILDGFDTQSIAFVAPVILKQWGLEAASFGPVFAAGLLGLMLGALAFSPIADRTGRKSVIVVSTAWFGVFSLATAYAASPGELLAYRFLTGLGLGGAMPNIIALTSECAPERLRATLVTVMFCGFPLGAVLGGLLSAKLIAAFGWPSVFLLGGVLPLVLVPVLLAWMPESLRFLARKQAEPLAGVPVRQLFTGGRAAGTVLLWIVFFANLLLLYFLINWLPTVLQRSGLPLERAIIGTVVLNAGGIAGGILLGWLVDKRGPYGVLLAAYVLGALCVAAIGSAPAAVAGVIAIVFFAGFFIIGSQFCMNALAAGAYPTAARATGVGWALGVGRIGSIIGPVVGGMLLSLGWEPGTLFLVAAGPAAVSAVAVWLLSALPSWKRQTF
jgi:MFS transporter, AAHS family, 4-hydroxybenzoate transporter